MDVPIKSPRKLIEVALPLDSINAACAKEKSIRHGHPSTMHMWWAPRPLAAARAVLFAQLVNDPGTNIGRGFRFGVEKKAAAVERKRLFEIIEDLVLWENTTNLDVIERARAEIRRSWTAVCDLNRDHPQAATLFNAAVLPAMYDPFAGGGAIPLEAQRLGLVASASDLNPVAVLITKAKIELPRLFDGRAPVGPAPSSERGDRLDMPSMWPGATGLAEDVRRYSAWMRSAAHARLGHLYPEVEVTVEMARGRADLAQLVGQKLTVVAWLWARTVKSPNPAFSQVHVPLAASFVLCAKPGQETYAQPLVRKDGYGFAVTLGAAPSEVARGTSAGKRLGFRCLMSGSPIEYAYIRREGMAGRMGVRMWAMVAEGPMGRVYLSPTAEMESVAASARPVWRPSGEMPKKHRNFQPPAYGMTSFGDLFTPRQLVALTTLSDLVSEARDRVVRDAVRAGFGDDDLTLEAGGSGARAYAEAVSVYLGFCVDKCTLTNTTSATWQKEPDRLTQAFSRQAIGMTWDFAEANPLSDAGGGFGITSNAVAKVLERLPLDAPVGRACQLSAAVVDVRDRIVSTDPPYYDNISYADLSDYFYEWLRRSMRPVFPDMFATIASPKAEELVALAHRHGGREQAEAFFLGRMTTVLTRIAAEAHPAFPLTIYYAFKQSDTDADTGTSSTGWETFLEALHRARLQLVGTWPMRTELTGSLKKTTNSLASSIVLVCRRRPLGAATVSRRDFLRELNSTLPSALDEMTRGAGGEASPVAPVDLSQAIIGPGMAVFSKYEAVLEADGSPMNVRTALQLINRFLAEDDFDGDTQFCLRWFEDHGWAEGAFGEADTLSRGKGTSVEGMKDAGVLKSGGGRVRLLKWSEYPKDWDPLTDARTPVWEALHHLIRALKQEGESASGALLASLGGKAEAVRQLAYRLYTLCERLGKAEDARAYNDLITSWTGIESAAASAPKPSDPQGRLFES